jgi:peptidoglycan/LPS O-acetylase OafA/YrhL
MERKYIPQYIPQLDGVRALAGLLLLVGHSAIDFDGVRFFYYISRYGMLGIQMSFVLSGFLVTGILLDTKTDQGYYKNFFARRGLKVLPLYYAQLATLVVMAGIKGRLAGVSWWIYIFCLSNMFFSGGKPPSALGTVWPLAVEVQFYLLWPFLVQKLNKRTIERIAFTTIIVVILLRLTGLLSYHHFLLQSDALAAGSLIACRREQLNRCGKWAILLMCTLPLGLSLPHGFVNELSRAIQVIASASLLIVLLVGNSWLVTIFRNRFLRYIGTISYGIFILHSFVFNAFRATVLHDRVLHSNSLWEISLYLLMEYVLVLILASASYHVFESRLLLLKRYFVYETAMKSSSIPTAAMVTLTTA